MADIELVVKIPKEKYDSICSMCETFPAEMKARGLKYIKDGILLPKGHGRLIDADKTISKICGSSCGCHLEECGQDMPCFSVTRIESASTIIEADKEVENEKM